MVNEAMWPVASPGPGAGWITIAMPELRAALDALFNKNVSAECHDETREVVTSTIAACWSAS
jgi:hypothetical protein